MIPDLVRLARPFAVLSVLGLAAGCVDLARDAPERRLYAFEVRREGRDAAAGGSPLLEVRRLQDSPRSEGTCLLYRRSDTRFESDFYHQFVAPTADLITEEVRSWLQGSGLFAGVIGSGSDAEPVYILDGVLSSLYADFRGDPPQAVLEAQFFLIRNGPGPPALVLQRDYEEPMPLADASPEGLVRGWNEGLRIILGSLESDLRACLAPATALENPARGG